MPRNQQSKSNDSAQLSVRCDAELKEDYQDVLDERGDSMSDDLRRHMEAVVRRERGRDTSDEFRPDDDTLARVYDALLAFANEDLKLTLDHYDSAVANEADVKKGSLDAFTHRLQREGYVNLSGDGPSVRHSKTYVRVKPPAADPDEWIHRHRTVAERREARRGGVPADD
ncbi:hypothetical protein ACFQFH_19995 [Halobaculum halobium]|uniref:Uncharacterized protein n=1 Tax=Halobaculum halobium TaxID=3032281 RepID=A0ABD5T748_9EURY|nr:hypothetical protein [Halobaculum sp. SYNS20]